jgi:hypothetical protein
MADINFSTSVPLGTRLHFSYNGADQTTLTVTYSRPVATSASAYLIKTKGPTQSSDAYLMFNLKGAWTVTISGSSGGGANLLELLVTAPPYFGAVFDWRNETQNYVGTFNVDADL